MQDARDDITLVVQGNRDGVPVSTFIRRMRALIRALVALDANLSADHKQTVRWLIVEASYNSPLRLRLAPKPLKGRTPNRKVANTYVHGVKMLEDGTGEPASFTPDILATTKRVLRTKSDKGGSVAIYAPDVEAVTPTRNLVKNINHILRRSYYQEYTTLEGKLDAINIHKGREFNIYDLLTDDPTKCYFSRDLYPKAYESLGKRVAVSGLVTYNRRDEPISMKVSDLELMRSTSELPQFRAGEEIDITRGLDSVEYVRRSRDVE